MITWEEYVLKPKKHTATKPSGLVNGPYGIWLLEYYKFLNGASDLLYDHLRTKMNRMTRFFNESSELNYTVGYGLTGFLWTMRRIVSDRDIYHKIIMKESLMPLVVEECRRLIWSGDFDLFTGAHGLLMYLISENALDQDVYQLYVDAQGEYLDVDGKLSGEGEMHMDEFFPGAPTGISHGLTGAVLMLLRLYQFRPSTHCRKLLQRLIPLIQQFGFGSGNLDLRANAIMKTFGSSDSILEHINNKIQWGYVLIKAGAVLNREDYKLCGLDFLESCKCPLEESNVGSKCAGPANAAYIYHRIWLITGIEKFKFRRNNWVTSIEKCWSKSGINQIHNVQKDATQIHSIVHGIAGSRLAYLTMKGKIDRQWDEWMLM